MKNYFEQRINFIKFYILFILFISSYCSVNDQFKQAKYIQDFTRYSEYQEALKNKKFNYGFLLIYSPYCPHCITFSSLYITLSEIFHNELFFYSAGTDYAKYRKDFWISGYPTLLFYNNGSYVEYKKKRALSKISQLIRNYTSHVCTEISYQNIKLVNNDIYQEYDRNIIIGFFNDEIMINSFCQKTNSLINSYIDLCYYVIRDESNMDRLEPKFKEMKENEIWAKNRINGEHNFIFNESTHKDTLFEKVVNKFEEIDDNNEIELISKMREKDFVFFVCDNDNMKSRYIEMIDKLYKNEKNEQFFKYYYVMYNKKIKLEKFANLEKDKIYHISKDFKSQTIIDDLNKFLNNNKDNKKIVGKEKEKISSDNTQILEVEKNKNTKNETKLYELQKGEEKDILLNEKKSSEIINEIQIDIKEENITDNTAKKDNINETFSDGIQNIRIIDNDFATDNKTRYKNFILNRARKRLKQKRDVIFKNKFLKEKIDNNKIKQEIIVNNSNNEEDEDKSYDIIKIVILLAVVILVMYILVTRYLCVGFIKVNDNQIIEFNNQPNTIEVI